MAHTAVEDRRKQLIAAAIDVIADVGLGKATTRLITSRADVPLALMHYCFQSKEELLTAVADEVLVRSAPSFERVPTDRGLAEAISSVTSELWAWIQRERNLQISLMELLVWKTHSTPASEVSVRVYTLTFELLAERLEVAARFSSETAQVPLIAVVRLIVAGLDGLFMQTLSTSDVATATADVERLSLAAVALAGIRKTDPQTPGSGPRQRRSADAGSAQR